MGFGEFIWEAGIVGFASRDDRVLLCKLACLEQLVHPNAALAGKSPTKVGGQLLTKVYGLLAKPGWYNESSNICRELVVVGGIVG